jgi:hypothetical protein
VREVSLALVTQLIQLIIAPVVMVSTRGIILDGLLGRYATVNDWLRGMAHERWGLPRSIGRTSADALDDIDPLVAERLHEIDIQIP